MISKYDQFAEDVGVIIPTGSIETFQTIGHRDELFLRE
jgi:hypothetical protein